MKEGSGSYTCQHSFIFQTAPVALETENRGEMKLALQYVPEPNPGMKMTQSSDPVPLLSALPSRNDLSSVTFSKMNS